MFSSNGNPVQIENLWNVRLRMATSGEYGNILDNKYEVDR